ncbi:TetR/AcrR family transcriptional regulator [Paenibacillus sp. NPDC058071]|uniref:TetR/AcrR family transcriptional regulator n=1 Tax=Paenibacillus sp. NPDC058071 TaxID=3346326 RepID=UPI0036D8384B
MRSNSKMKEVLAATASIIEQQGMDKVTLEAVAKQAGMSKGGLLHHFPNKEALIKGMIDECTSLFLEDVHRRAEESPQAAGKWHRAYLESAINDKVSNGLIVAYTASLFSNPEFIVQLDHVLKELHLKMEEDKLDPIASAMFRMAVDGLWYSEIFNVGKLKPDLKHQLIEQLNGMLAGRS